MPMWAPKAVEKLASTERWSVMSVEGVLPLPIPPYSSGMSTEANPSSPAFRISPAKTPGCLASMAAALGRISSRANCAAVAAIWRCSSFRSSGVKTSAGVRVSSRKLPPAAATMGEVESVDMIAYLQLSQHSTPAGRRRANALQDERGQRVPPGSAQGCRADGHRPGLDRSYPLAGVSRSRLRQSHPPSTTIAVIPTVEARPVRRACDLSESCCQPAPNPAWRASDAVVRASDACSAERPAPLPEGDAECRPDLQGALPLELL